VASLYPAATFAATADADPKARRHWPHLADVDLPLLGVAFVLDVTAAERAPRRQASVEVQVGRGGGSHAVTVTAVRFAGLSSRVAWSFFWAAFRERRRLALAGTLGSVQRSLELLYAFRLCSKFLVLFTDLFLEAGHDRLKLCDSLSKAHTNLLANSGPSVVDHRAVRATYLVSGCYCELPTRQGYRRQYAKQVRRRMPSARRSSTRRESARSSSAAKETNTS
jgi:hypothetical protein